MLVGCECCLLLLWCWWVPGGTLVGVSVLSVTWLEFCMMLAISSPLWSSVGEYHIGEWALMSPVIMLFFSVVKYVRQFVMSMSSVWWLVFVVSLGAMYIFVMWISFCLFKCILSIWSSVFCVFRCLYFGESYGVFNICELASSFFVFSVLSNGCIVV